MKIGLIGQGGHSRVIQDILRANKSYEVIAFFDDTFQKENIINAIFYGPIDAIHRYLSVNQDMKLIIAIGNNEIRQSITQRLNLREEQYATAIHPTALISPNALIGHGTVIMPNVVINADAKIGAHSIINTSSVIEHDNDIDNFVHISPNATLTGGVTVKEGVHIGAGATIIPNKKIGEWTIVGAGSTVIHDLPGHCTAVGTPARVKANRVIGGGMI